MALEAGDTVMFERSPSDPVTLRCGDIDLTEALAGPFCGMLLGDLGADVVKIEPLHGEIARWMSPPQANTAASISRWDCNGSRRSA